MNFGERMKYYRKSLNLSQQELAQKLNVTNQTISSWEVNRTEPNMGMVFELCSIFDCNMEELLGVKKPDTMTTTTQAEYNFLKRYRYADNETRKVVERILESVDLERAERILNDH